MQTLLQAFLVVCVSDMVLVLAEKKTVDSDRRAQQAWNDASEQRQRRYELVRGRIERGERAIELLSEDVGARSYAVRQVLSAIAAGEARRAAVRWSDYMASVAIWNRSIGGHRMRFAIAFGTDKADWIQNGETEHEDLKEPVSLHGRFYVLHDELRKGYEQLTARGKKPSSGQISALDRRAEELDREYERVVEALTRQSLTAASDLLAPRADTAGTLSGNAKP